MRLTARQSALQKNDPFAMWLRGAYDDTLKGISLIAIFTWQMMNKRYKTLFEGELNEWVTDNSLCSSIGSMLYSENGLMFRF